MIKKEKYNVAVVGATGVVGVEMAKVLEERMIEEIEGLSDEEVKQQSDAL